MRSPKTSPKTSPPSPSFKRNLGLFLFISFVFIAFFGIYWYKFIPGNRDELNERGFRILRQLSSNISTKYDGLQKDLDNTYGDIDTCYRMEKPLQDAFQNYIVAKIGYDTAKCIPFYEKDTSSNIDVSRVKQCDDDYHFAFRVTPHSHISLKVSKYLKNILATRDDLFESYLLLLRPEKTEPGFKNEFKMSDSSAARSNYEIVYEHTALSGADRLNIDSALRLEKNSDLTSITGSRIAGKDYRLFLQPFRMHDAELVLVGLVSNANYTKEIKSVPVGFASALIIIMIVLLTVLPLIKIFFVGPKEHISIKDVLSLNLAIYIGTSFLVLILLYFCIAFVTGQGFNARLSEISKQIAGEFNGEIQKAGRQLDRYDGLFTSAGANRNLLPAVRNNTTDRRLLDVADSLFIPELYRNFSRVFWMDEDENTLIKWNPYKIHVPLTLLKGDPYFDSLLKIKPVRDSLPSRELIVYAGKSNVTGEFQVFISRLSSAMLTSHCNKDSLVKAHSITMAAFPNCSNYPILPPGFGFSIIDNANFNVLINSDPRRNLSENMMDETIDNEKLKYCVQYKVRGPIDPVSMYGSDHVFLVTPLEGRELSLLVYYDKTVIFHNLFRLIHFTAESLLYLFGALTLCVLAVTGFSNRPGKLRFNLKQVVWVRPSIRNLQSYRFTGAYWTLLFFFTFLFLVMILAFSGDGRMVFYIVLLLPFYTLWGFVASRKKESIARRTDGPKSKYFLFQVIDAGPAIFFFILIFNYVFWALIHKETGAQRIIHHILLLFYQAGALLLFYYFYRNQFFLDKEKGKIKALFTRLKIIPPHSGEDFSKMYLVSLSWSVLLISIIPVIGIMLYGYQSEKIQYLKSKQLALASAYESRLTKVSDAITDEYKEVVRRNPRFGKFIDSLKYEYSQYLFDKDTIYTADSMFHPAYRQNLPDAQYALLLDSLFLITPNEYESFSIRDRSADSSWRFYKNDTDLYLGYKRDEEGQKISHLTVKSALGSPFRLLFSDRYWFWSLMLIVFGLLMLLLGSRLLDSVINRIFLLKYYENPPDGDDRVVEKFLSPAVQKLTGIHNMTPDQVILFLSRERALLNHTAKFREEYILSMTLHLSPSYEKLWKSLDAEEQYFLYDFAIDGYANYKDAEMLTRLTEMKLLLYEYSHFRLITLSFRNFLLAKKGTPEIQKLKGRYAVPGMWETMRVPALVLIAVAGIFIFTTQDDLSHKISAVLTSIGAMIPLLLKLTGRNSSSA